MSKITHSLPFPLALAVFTVHLLDLIFLENSVQLPDNLLPECMHWFYQERSSGPNEHAIKEKI